jgi:hypothetical protein
MDIKIGDIIDGKRVTKVFRLGGEIAYQSEPVKKNALIDEDEQDILVEKPKRTRKKNA